MGIDKVNNPLTPDKLRRQAEKRLRENTAQTRPPQSELETQRLVHELEVHQIELEMQNEELSQARNLAETSLEKFTDLYDFAPVGYFTLSRNGSINAVNLGGAGLLGVERSRLIGQNFRLFVTEEYRSAFTAFLDKVFLNQGKATFESALLNRGELPLIVQIEALAIASGQECRLALIDITGRRLAEEAFRDSENRMYKLTEMAADAIVVLDAEGTVTFCNTAAERMFGCPGSEITHCDFHQQFIPEQVRRAAKQGFERFKEQGTGLLIGTTTEVSALRQDGTEFPVELSISALDIKGKWHAIAIIRDITGRKQADERIGEVIRQQHAILDNIPNIAWLKDRNGRYVAVNEPFGKAFGVAPKDLIGKTDYDIYPRERAEKYEMDSRAAMTSGTRFCSEESCLTLEGNVQHLEKTETPIFNDAGLVIGIIGIAHDITTRKEVEITLRHDSTHDGLTGLYNRAFFDEELERLAQGGRFPVSVVMADVNGLKTVNDTLGHEAGDNLIRLAARVILEAFRPGDIVARIGGDEFAVLLPATAQQVAEEAVARITNSSEVSHGHVSISFGVASAEKQNQIAEALRQSDQGMYRDKSGQKDLSSKGKYKSNGPA